MQTHRLFEIIYLLLDQGQMTASQLAAHFEVSVRTIYRDIDRLSLSGVPIYTNVGKNGGIALMDGYTLDKSILSDAEQSEILTALQTLQAVEYPDPDGLITKLGTFFKKNQQNWIEVDFTGWGGSIQDRERSEELKNAILTRHTIRFSYWGADGTKSERTADPIKLLFKGHNWYLQAYCHTRQDYRVFKLFRIRDLQVLEAAFDPYPTVPFTENAQIVMTPLHFTILKNRAYRVYDEFAEAQVLPLPGGDFDIHTCLPVDNWLVGYLLSFGGDLILHSPETLRASLRAELEKALAHYT
ncbi:YafY family protein [Eubacterium sp. 1001713B170207_170306_E7]|uniref:helix-turn-helix transcriptional regulator n=1 Tax=Eubacterium sp. 1001713B170207_170306_E7 TaxID=2787097 RepID=UPI00189A7D7F|nr:YafY family protein [Eubacterium sp. 1001713B170207_170306_E7]